MATTNKENTIACKVENEGKNNGMRYLDILEKIASKLKSESKEFVVTLEKLIEIEDHGDLEKKKLQYNLLSTVFSNIMDYDVEELTALKKNLTNVFLPLSLRQLMTDNSSIDHVLLLGQGAFGIVTLGILTKSDGSTIEVAVKHAKERKYDNIITHEALVLSQLNHKNILKLLAVNRSEPEIVLELMRLGNICDAVEEYTFTELNLLKILGDVATGMEYLAGKNFLHRDLACRNIFLNEKKQCKIGDFGLAVYVGDTNGEYEESVYNPIDYNVSPETKSSKIFTIENDVWALGILCWELFFIALQTHIFPPNFMKKMVLEKFHHEKMLPIPKGCPPKLYTYIVNDLLNENPKKRPNFTTVKDKIAEYIHEKNCNILF